MERLKQLAFGTYDLVVKTVDEDGGNVNTVAPYGVTLYDGAGAVVATATPAHQDHELRYSIPAATITKLDTYRLVWTATVAASPAEWTTEFEVVGDHLFTIAQFRTTDRAFENATNYPAAAIAEIRNWVEDVIEGPRAANVAFVRRSARVTTDGTGRAALMLPNLEIDSVYSLTVAGTAWTSEQIATLTADDGVIYLEADSPISVWPSGRKNITLHYVHGRSRPPGPITRAALMLAKEYAVKSDVPGRATATSIGDQLFRLTIAGRDGVTGLPDVDAAIAQFGRITYTVG